MKRLIIAATLAASLVTPAFATTLTETYTSFYSFGDSLTDDGKFGLAGAGGLLEAPSFGGRFTNGLTWSEYIEDDFAATGDDTRNYALGGATGGDLNVLNPGPLATFGKQIDAFTAELPFIRNPGSNPLVSLWFGANDIFQGITSPVDAAIAVTAGIRRIAELSAAAGTSFDDFLIMPVPDIPTSPGASEAFNTQLLNDIIGLRAEGFNITVYDSADAFDAIVADFFNGSPLYGITELETPCAVNFTDGDPSSCLDEGKDPNTFFFADTVHPSAPVHALVAQQVNAKFDLAAVPLPATLPFAVFALGALGWASRRRAG